MADSRPEAKFELRPLLNQRVNSTRSGNWRDVWDDFRNWCVRRELNRLHRERQTDPAPTQFNARTTLKP
jgi:hypothetical protein